ncbi:MAG: hypothetical protein JNK53_07705, partial [Phycisphaerae bacterium]|nr:hypothetical protein [Phycisphaerae bacterium]
MKLKGINPFEQHIEKIVLVCGILAVGGVAAWQVINAPVATLGSKQVTPGEVDALLEARARALQLQLRGDSTISIPMEGVAMAAPTFETLVAKDVAPSSSLSVQVPSFASTLMKMRETSTDVWYHEPQLASLKMQDVVQTADALTPDSAKLALKIAPSLSTRFSGTEGPQDVVWTTPVAVMNLKEIRAELSRSEPTAKPPRAAIPGVWYIDTPFVVDVTFQRREVKADGTYGPVTTVPAFTPRDEELDFRSRIAGAKADLRDRMFNILSNPTDQAQVLQMPFFETVNSSFVSPTIRSESAAATPATEGAGDPRRVLQLRTQLESKKRSAQRVLDRLAKIGGPWDEAKEQAEEEARKQAERERKEAEKGNKGGGGGGGGFGMGGGGMDGRRKSSDAEEADKKRERDLAAQSAERKAQTRLLQRFESEIANIEKELGATPSASASVQAATVPNLVQDDQV